MPSLLPERAAVLLKGMWVAIEESKGSGAKTKRGIRKREIPPAS